jgi:quercetin dioxygenase-like cupin family protein
VLIIPPKRHEGSSGKAGSQFSGAVFPYMTMPPTDGVTINTVNFTPGARTYWHSHESGQILQVIAGRGRIQAEGGPVHVLRAGDTVWAPPGERHWHGGSPDFFMTHTAISIGVTSWAEEVTDDQFNGESVDEDD